MQIPPRLELRETADTLAALPRFWVHSLGRQRTTGERTTSRPNTQPGLPSNNHLWKLPRSGPSPRRSAAHCARLIIFVQGGGRAAGHEVSSEVSSHASASKSPSASGSASTSSGSASKSRPSFSASASSAALTATPGATPAGGAVVAEGLASGAAVAPAAGPTVMPVNDVAGLATDVAPAVTGGGKAAGIADGCARTTRPW